MNNLLVKFQMVDCVPAATLMEEGARPHLDMDADMADTTTYQRLVGGLIYLTHTRPDFAYVVSCLSRRTATTTLGSCQAGVPIQ